ncbi:two-component regulator propeller domain-containing protein [Bernardetia sp.]|uniref:two-component regulator propeller domain-containing protein n=1 Tax=Bernardetia sp. TaxID=1937974 RepID=UPI0025B8133D|nr:two-component regulator propeller domain-containing protein [Bernardetia sp.]
MINKSPSNKNYFALDKLFLFKHVNRFVLCFVVALFYFYTPSSIALDPQKQISQYILDQWTTKEGLPTNTLNYVFQSEDGFIWASTYSGFIRFDGVDFKIFDKKNLPYLTNSSISAIYQTKDDSLWIGTHGSGLMVQKDHNFNFYTAKTTKGNFPDYSIESISKIGDALWLGTRGNGIITYQDGIFTPFSAIPEISTISINELQYREIGTDRIVWIGTEGKGLFSYQNERIERYNVENGSITNDVITGLLLDRTNTLWVGTINGVNRIRNGKSEIIEELKGVSVNDIIEDKEGSIWFATSAGLFRKNPVSRVYEVLNTENGLPHNNVMNICTDKEGNLWLAMYRAGLIRLKDGKFLNYTTQQGLASVSVSSIQEIEKNNYWVGSDAGIINTIKNQNVGRYDLKTPLSTDRLRAIFKDREGNIWVGSYAGVLRISSTGEEKLFTIKDGLTDNQVRVITQTINGSIWVGTRGGGLNEYIPSEQRWIPFTKDDGLSSNFVMGVEPTSEGNLIVSTNDAGVDIINLKTRKVSKVYTQAEGLPSNLAFSARYDSEKILWICANSGLVAISPKDINKINIFNSSNNFPVDAVFDIREDSNNNLWLSSSSGAIRIERASVTEYLEGKRTDLEVKVFDRSDGMKEEECTGAVHFLKDSQGRMWFPTIGGLSMIDPNNIQKNTLAPPTYITKLSVDSIDYKFPSFSDEEIIVEAGARRILFHFTGLSLVSPSDMHFKYRLKGFDEDWIEVKNERDALYTGLPPKEYTFEVISANNDGVWSEEVAKVRFVVKPFFYQTAYFWIAIIVAFLLLVWLAYRYQIRRITKQNLKLEETVKQRTAEINQQKEEIESQRDRIEEQRKAITESYEQIHKVGEIGQKITAKLQTDTLAQTIYQNILMLMPAEGFGMGVYNAREQKIDFKNFMEHGEPLPPHSDSLSQVNRLSVQCLSKNKTIFINDIEEYFAQNEQLKYLDIGKLPQSLIYVPLVINEKTVGVLTVQSFRKNAYAKEDIVILEALAAYISIAQSNAKSYEIIQEKNRNITDSIRYALTIQQAVLPTPEEMNSLFSEYFVVFKPKDIVSGDFYWVVNYKGKTFVAIVDCTGHGVPGGFMSMIGNALLNEIVTIERIFSPAQILEKLHQDVRAALQQEKAKNDDGMDISIFCLERIEEGNKITFAGAKQSLYYSENNEKITKLRGNRMSIGGRRGRKRDESFEEKTIILQNNTMIYMMSDGFADQADIEGHKIGSKRILEQLEKIKHLSAIRQKEELEILLEQHQRTAPQRDDITLLGIRL